MLMPVIILNSSPAKCELVPLPFEAILSLPATAPRGVRVCRRCRQPGSRRPDAPVSTDKVALSRYESIPGQRGHPLPASRHSTRTHTWIYARVAEAFRERGLGMPKTRLVTLSWPLIDHFVFNGRHIMAYPRSVAVRHSLKVLPVNLPIRPWPLSILTLKNRTPSPVAERFMECAREVAKSMAERPHAGKKS
jgi:DNA-binding transcriptional LysR family regulator